MTRERPSAEEWRRQTALSPDGGCTDSFLLHWDNTWCSFLKIFHLHMSMNIIHTHWHEKTYILLYIHIYSNLVTVICPQIATHFEEASASKYILVLLVMKIIVCINHLKWKLPSGPSLEKRSKQFHFKKLTA